MVLEEFETQIPRLMKAGKVTLRQEPGDWKNYQLHFELLLQGSKSHHDQMMMQKTL